MERTEVSVHLANGVHSPRSDGFDWPLDDSIQIWRNPSSNVVIGALMCVSCADDGHRKSPRRRCQVPVTAVRSGTKRDLSTEDTDWGWPRISERQTSEMAKKEVDETTKGNRIYQ